MREGRPYIKRSGCYVATLRKDDIAQIKIQNTALEEEIGFGSGTIIWNDLESVNDFDQFSGFISFKTL